MHKASPVLGKPRARDIGKPAITQEGSQAISTECYLKANQDGYKYIHTYG
jgi:hypothetical protein